MVVEGEYFIEKTKYAANWKFEEIYFSITAFIKGTLPVIIITLTLGLSVSFFQRRQASRQTMFAETPSSVNQQQRYELEDLSKCFIALAISFLVLVAPYTVFSVMSYSYSNRVGVTCSFVKAHLVLLDLILLNSAVNFFIYYWKLAPFRKAIQKVCHCKRNDSPPAPISTVYSRLTSRNL